MRFGDAIRALSSAVVERATAKQSKFVEIVTANLPYTPGRGDHLALTKLYNENLWVRSLVGKISRRVGRVKWYLEDEAGERIDRHPALDFINSGSPKLRGRQARTVTAVHRDLCGEAFWAVGLDKTGRPVSYAPMPPHWVFNIPEGDDQSGTYEIRPKVGTVYRIPGNQIIHFRDPDPLDPYGRGSSNARAAKVELDSDAEAAKYLASYFANRARPDILVTGVQGAPLTQKDVPRLEESWLEKFQGAKRAFKPMFSAQPLEIKELSGSLRDNEMSKVRENLKTTLAEFYGVPPEIIGRLEHSNRATIDAADFIFGKYVLEPRLDELQDVLEPWLIERFGLEGLTLCYDCPVEENSDFQLSVMQAQPTAFTKDEFRRLAKMKPLADKLPEFGEPIAPPPAPDPAGGPGKGNPGDKNPPKDAPKDQPPAKAVDATHKSSDHSPSFEKKTISPDDIVRVSDALSDPSVIAEASKVLDKLFLELLTTYGEDLLNVLNSEANFAVNAAVADWLAERGSRLISTIDGTTKTALKAALVDGAAANETVSELVARIEKVFDDAAETRAPIIGQTEATAITGFGSKEAARQGGFDFKKWLSSGDHVVRASHRAMHGQVKPLNQPFQSPSGEQADFPGDFGDPAEDVNCRCAMRPIVTGEEKSHALTDAAFEAAWDGMNRAVAGKISKQMTKLFNAQKVVCLAVLNRLTGGKVYA